MKLRPSLIKAKAKWGSHGSQSTQRFTLHWIHRLWMQSWCHTLSGGICRTPIESEQLQAMQPSCTCKIPLEKAWDNWKTPPMQEMVTESTTLQLSCSIQESHETEGRWKCGAWGGENHGSTSSLPSLTQFFATGCCQFDEENAFHKRTCENQQAPGIAAGRDP